MKFKVIDGGVTAPKGFLASGIHCGVKEGTTKKDLALIYSEVMANGAGMYTLNKVKGAPIQISKNHLHNGKAQAIIVNSGNANTCNGENGLKDAETMTKVQAKALNIDTQDVVVASTGVIGVPLNIDAIINGIPCLTKSLSKDGSKAAAESIMTTDTFMKEYSIEFEVGGKTISLGAIAKGSGMIEPNMGTMLSFITTDLAISSDLLKEALKETVKVSYNRITVDGDTSTNDTVFLLANGLAENEEITEKNEDYNTFVEALKEVCITISKMLAKDGEGATKLIECTVNGAYTEDDADVLAKSVIKSSLVKTAIFGSDANWGRILCALGYSGANFDPDKVDVYFESEAGSIQVCKAGASLPFSEDLAKEILLKDEVKIKVDLFLGDASVTVWGCDLTYDYVKINGDYRS